jgi:prevent-host-death family protein
MYYRPRAIVPIGIEKTRKILSEEMLTSKVQQLRMGLTAPASRLTDRTGERTARSEVQGDSPATPAISATEARKRLPELLNRVAYSKERIYIAKHGRPLACLVPVEEAQALQSLEEATYESDERAEALRQLQEQLWGDVLTP